MNSDQPFTNEAIIPLTNSGTLSQNNGVENEVILSAIKVNKYFGDKHVLKDVDFEVRKREVVALIGPSGSGKSTLLRCFNGLEKYTSGQIEGYQRPDLHTRTSTRSQPLGKTSQPDSQRAWDGFPEFQPLSAYDRASEHY